MSTSVLYISYDGMTDPLGQSQVIPYLIGLTQLGYSFTLISCEKEEAFQKNRTVINEVLRKHGIDWRPISYTKTPPVLSTIYDLFVLKRLAYRLHKEKSFKIIHCRSYIAALVGLKMKKQLGVKFVFDMRGFWADERVDGKLWNLKNPVFKTVYRYFKQKEKEFLNSADYTISLTQHAKDEIYTWKGLSNSLKIQVIPCCVDLELFNKKNILPEKINALREELKISPDDKILLYLGSIGTWYMLEEMMEFFSVLKKEMPSAKFLFVTKDERERILQTAEKFQVKDDIILRPGAREEIPYLISLSNYSVFFILPAYSKKASSPTKQGEIMAMGIPVICNTNVGDTDQIIKKYHSGVLVEEFGDTAYRKALLQLNKDFDQEEIILGANEYFSLESGVRKYAEVYRNVLSY